MFVTSLRDVPAGAVLVRPVGANQWRVYMPGDADIPAFLTTKPTAAEIEAAAARQAKLDGDALAAAQDAKLMALAEKSPAEIRAWIDASVTSLAQARDVIATLAIAVSVLARRL